MGAGRARFPYQHSRSEVDRLTAEAQGLRAKLKPEDLEGGLSQAEVKMPDGRYKYKTENLPKDQQAIRNNLISQTLKSKIDV